MTRQPNIQYSSAISAKTGTINSVPMTRSLKRTQCLRSSYAQTNSHAKPQANSAITDHCKISFIGQLPPAFAVVGVLVPRDQRVLR